MTDEAAIDALLEREPRNIDALVLKGELREQAGDDRAAHAFYQTALRTAVATQPVPRSLHSEVQRAQEGVVRGQVRFQPAGRDDRQVRLHQHVVQRFRQCRGEHLRRRARVVEQHRAPGARQRAQRDDAQRRRLPQRPAHQVVAQPPAAARARQASTAAASSASRTP